MATEKARSAEARNPEEAPKILTKPLPLILNEMEENIRLATEAARRAEGAARAAEVFKKAAGEAASKAEGTAKAAIESVQAAMLGRIESLEEKFKNLEEATFQEEVIVLREISKEEAEKEILKLFSQGQTLYYSDIAEQLRLDLKLVVEICNKLQSKGEIEVVEDALQRSR